MYRLDILLSVTVSHFPFSSVTISNLSRETVVFVFLNNGLPSSRGLFLVSKIELLPM
jgi:hypothetical protein